MDKEGDTWPVTSVGKKSLLQKYDIPIERFSYDYISQCTNAKELERIVIVLRSGEEGCYPDLTKHAEERLGDVKPTSSALRRADPVINRNSLEPGKRIILENDLSEWTREMRMRDMDLEQGRSTRSAEEPITEFAIRQISFDRPENKRITENRKKHDRIVACDYAGWDKYDADTELNRIDLRQEQTQAEAKKAQRMHDEKEKKMKQACKAETLAKYALTGTELNVMAEKEREKGNEAYKLGEYDEALHYYNSSIGSVATLNAYNNRAITWIKLQRYNDAVKDCNEVISVDNTNVKALLRRGLAHDCLEKRAHALADYEAVLKLEPSNETAIRGLKELRKPCNSKKVRMKIEESAETDDEKTQGAFSDVSIPLPDTKGEKTNDITNRHDQGCVDN